MISILLISSIVLYLAMIGLLIYGFDAVDALKLQDLPPKTKFSIVIPFRNEAKHLVQLLDSILALNYPQEQFEIILIDDDSQDDSVGLIEDFVRKRMSKNPSTFRAISILKNERNSNSPKKDAICLAISKSKYDWIVTTDADCLLPKFWLDALDEHIQLNDTVAVVGPVAYQNTHTFFKRFQALDFLSLQGATMGGFGIKRPFLCNGANFAYLKSAFNVVNGFEGNTAIASGDDVFLLEKFLERNSRKVHYLKSEVAIVKTHAVDSWKQLCSQRVRWASKASKSKNWFSNLVAIAVLLGNLTCLVLIPLTIFNLVSLKMVIALFTIKFSIDFLLVFKSSRFFDQERLLPSYMLSSLIYPFFSVYIVLLSFIKPYTWKGRTFKK